MTGTQKIDFVTQIDMALGLVLIADTTLGVAAASIIFSSIPGTYKHLRLIVSGRTARTSADNLCMQFNGDTGANYDDQYLYGNSAVVAGGSDAASATPFAGVLPWTTTGRTSMQTVAEIIIANYAGTTFEKASFCMTGFADSTALNSFIWNSIVSWRNTAAITAIKIFTYSGANLVAGTRATLYGML